MESRFHVSLLVDIRADKARLEGGHNPWTFATKEELPRVCLRSSLGTLIISLRGCEIAYSHPILHTETQQRCFAVVIGRGENPITRILNFVCFKSDFKKIL